MQIRLIAAALNGTLVLIVYVAGWGVANFPTALLEVALAVAAALATWYALRKAGPKWMIPLKARRSGRGLLR
jgi:hypothetical protein